MIAVRHSVVASSHVIWYYCHGSALVREFQALAITATGKTRRVSAHMQMQTIIDRRTVRLEM